MHLLLAAATPAEIAPFVQLLAADWKTTAPNHYRHPDGSRELRVLYTGVGLMAATFALTEALLAGRPDFVLQAGIAGAYNQQLPLGGLYAVSSEALGDLGAEDGPQLLDLYELGLADPDEVPFAQGRLPNPQDAFPFFSHLPRAGALTVHSGGGHAPTIAARIARHGADIESMEGAALHYVCLQLGLPFLQIRALSNYVTPRDRDAWQIGKAVKALNDALVAELL